MIKRTEILCPNCLKKKLLHDEASKETWCDNCGQGFIKLSDTTVKFR